jgi:hypothetical protein
VYAPSILLPPALPQLFHLLLPTRTMISLRPSLPQLDCPYLPLRCLSSSSSCFTSTLPPSPSPYSHSNRPSSLLTSTRLSLTPPTMPSLLLPPSFPQIFHLLPPPTHTPISLRPSLPQLGCPYLPLRARSGLLPSPSYLHQTGPVQYLRYVPSPASVRGKERDENRGVKENGGR